MTNMFFAGIPMEGSGVRPLEADLYGAEQQGVDHENLSATGNLNVGVVMEYDEHMQRHLSGGIKSDDNPFTSTSGYRHGMMSLPVGDGGTHNISYTGGDNSSLLQTTTLVTPSSPSLQLPTQPTPSSNVSAATAVDSSSSSSRSSNSDGSGSASHGFSHFASGNGETIYNITTNYDTTNNTTNDTTNTTYNLTENNYSYNGGNIYDGGNIYIHNGNTTINNYGGGEGGNHGGVSDGGSCHGGDPVLGMIDTIVSGGTNIVNAITHDTLSTINQAIGSVDFLAADIINTVGNTLNQVIGTVDTTITATNGLLSGLVNDVNHTLGNVTDTGNSIISSLTPAENNVFNIADGLDTVAGNIINEPISLLNSNSLSLNSLGNTLSGITDNTIHTGTSLLMPAVDTAGNLVSGVSGNLPSLLDASASVLTPTSPEASGSLINVTGSLASGTSGPAQAGTSGLVNVDAALLSSAHAGSTGGDGVSISVNPNALSQHSGSPVPEITVPLPTSSQSVPIVSQVTGALTSAGATVNEATGGTLDHSTDLSALTHNASNVAAVDTGVLFTGTHVSAGHDGSGLMSGSHDTMHVGTLLHASALGLH